MNYEISLKLNILLSFKEIFRLSQYELHELK